MFQGELWNLEATRTSDMDIFYRSQYERFYLLQAEEQISLLSDQAMWLSFIKNPVKDGRFSILDRTFQGQKHGCKDFGIP